MMMMIMIIIITILIRGAFITTVVFMQNGPKTTFAMNAP